MPQTVHTRLINILSCISIICAILGTCTPADAKKNICADLVVYGKIFTSEKNKIVGRLQ